MHVFIPHRNWQIHTHTHIHTHLAYLHAHSPQMHTRTHLVDHPHLADPACILTLGVQMTQQQESWATRAMRDNIAAREFHVHKGMSAADAATQVALSMPAVRALVESAAGLALLTECDKFGRKERLVRSGSLAEPLASLLKRQDPKRVELVLAFVAATSFVHHGIRQNAQLAPYPPSLIPPEHVLGFCLAVDESENDHGPAWRVLRMQWSPVVHAVPGLATLCSQRTLLVVARAILTRVINAAVPQQMPATCVGKAQLEHFFESQVDAIAAMRPVPAGVIVWDAESASKHGLVADWTLSRSEPPNVWPPSYASVAVTAVVSGASMVVTARPTFAPRPQTRAGPAAPALVPAAPTLAAATPMAADARLPAPIVPIPSPWAFTVAGAAAATTSTAHAHMAMSALTPIPAPIGFARVGAYSGSDFSFLLPRS